jgi:hypothetical protein
MKDSNKIVSPRVTALLNKRLVELEMTRNEFIRKFHRDHGEDAGARNHLFKILNGTTIVGERVMLPLIVKSLDLNIEEARQLVKTDKITSKGWASALPKASKIVQEVATVMESLSKRDQWDVLKYAKMKANLL